MCQSFYFFWYRVQYLNISHDLNISEILRTAQSVELLVFLKCFVIDSRANSPVTSRVNKACNNIQSQTTNSSTALMLHAFLLLCIHVLLLSNLYMYMYRSDFLPCSAVASLMMEQAWKRNVFLYHVYMCRLSLVVLFSVCLISTFVFTGLPLKKAKQYFTTLEILSGFSWAREYESQLVHNPCSWILTVSTPKFIIVSKLKSSSQ